MKIESPSFTQADLDHFLDEQLDRERIHLAQRLESASARLAAIAPRIQAGGGDDDWTNHQVLAHIAVLSKFYGVMVHKISTGQLTEIDMLANTNLRDVAGEQMAAIEPTELMSMIAADHARTAKLLRTTNAAALRRGATLPSGETVTAEFLARYPLVNHLEEHVEQLERSLSYSTPAGSAKPSARSSFRIEAAALSIISGSGFMSWLPKSRSCIPRIGITWMCRCGTSRPAITMPTRLGLNAAI